MDVAIIFLNAFRVQLVVIGRKTILHLSVCAFNIILKMGLIILYVDNAITVAWIALEL
jgi:hypothetical protein